MSWAVVVDHEGCGGEGHGLSVTLAQVEEIVKDAVRTHNDEGGPLVITITQECPHDTALRKADVEAARAYLKATATGSTRTDGIDTLPAYQAVLALKKKLVLCHKCRREF